MKRDVINDVDDDDEVNQSITNLFDSNTVLRNSSSGLSIYISPLISGERCEEGRKQSQRETFRQSLLSLSSQLILHTVEQGTELL